MIEAYSHDRHYAMLGDWLRARGITIPPPRLFSDHGYCVDRTAIGFLFRHPNCGQAFIDNIAANPEATPGERDVALDTLLRQLAADARHAGCEAITILGNLPAMKRRFEKLGYRAHGDYTLYVQHFSGRS